MIPIFAIPPFVNCADISWRTADRGEESLDC
jgi:hypothetical protein